MSRQKFKPHRSVTEITKYLSPKEMFELITSKEWPYVVDKERYTCRDRALMATAYISAGRISEIVQGYKHTTQVVYENGKKKRKAIIVGKYPGLQRENVTVRPDYIYFSGVLVVKRTQKVIERHGIAVTIRADFVTPLRHGVFENPYWDQLIPFSYLLLDYLKKFAPKKGSIFPITRTRAYQIINYVTGMWPHWFRAQAEHFYGNFLLTDSIKLSKFVKVVDPKSVKTYIGYDWREQLKDKSLGMDFDWIDNFLEEYRKNTEKVC